MSTVQPILLSKIFMGQHAHHTTSHTPHTVLHFWLGTIWHHTSSCHHFMAHYRCHQIPPISPPCTYCTICTEAVSHHCPLTLVSCWAPHPRHVPLASLHTLCAETHSRAAMPIPRASHGTCSSDAKIPMSETVGRINIYHSLSQWRKPLQGNHSMCTHILHTVVHIEPVLAWLMNRLMRYISEFVIANLFMLQLQKKCSGNSQNQFKKGVKM